MKIFNSSTNTKIDLSGRKITIYNCGPTVYNYVHIGNVRPLIVFDVLYRYLLSLNKDVLYVQNITDVDDKIINAAAEANITEKELTDKYTKAYLDLFTLLNVKPLLMPKVSDHIEEIQEYIQQLIDKGVAYVEKGDVYFDVSKVKNYGHVSHQNIDELLEGVRKGNKQYKRNPLDFVLWKQTDRGINWKSPWSVGRPGWHTECCVLINKYVGDHVMIHGGGVDLKFPHHENENAQNYALYGRDIADIWMHVGHINVNGAKMSKSLHNFILVKDIVTKDNANGLRWFFYQAKYEQPVNFAKEQFDAAIKEVNNVVKSLAVAKTWLITNNVDKHEIVKLNNEFNECLADDLNLPNAITVVLQQVRDLNRLVREKNYAEANTLRCNIMKELDVLGIRYDVVEHDVELIKKWKEALDSKDFTNGDKYRAELIKKGLL